jgi:pimeloyl-ACP methyl ester carboxylesterase
LQSGGRVELEVLEGIGHHVPLSAPAALARAVTAMLSEVSS